MLRQIELTQIRFRIGKVDRKHFINKVCINKMDCIFFKYWNEVTWWFKCSNRKLYSTEKLRLSLDLVMLLHLTHVTLLPLSIQQLRNLICNYLGWIKEETCDCITSKNFLGSNINHLFRSGLTYTVVIRTWPIYVVLVAILFKKTGWNWGLGI